LYVVHCAQKFFLRILFAKLKMDSTKPWTKSHL
jgi:hypothetical protein